LAMERTMHVQVVSDGVSRRRAMGMKKLLGLAAVLEAATGLVLIIHPSLVAQLLFGDGVSGAGMALARVAGFALLALGVACWPSREAGSGIARSARAMLTYSLLVTIYLVYLGIVVHLTGMLLWPGVVAHAVWILLLVVAWRNDRQRLRGSTP
jgi:hypothetical protein